MGEVIKVAKEAGVELSMSDIDICHRLGAPSKVPHQTRPAQTQPTNAYQTQQLEKPKPRQTIIRFISRRKRDQVYDSRFKLKGVDTCKGVFINEDLSNHHSLQDPHGSQESP